MKTLRMLSIVAGAAVLVAQIFSTQAQASILLYTFDSGSYFDLGGGNNYSATGSFDFNTVNDAVTNVTYTAYQTGSGPAGPFAFTAATSDGTSITFTGDGSGVDVDTYDFQRSLAFGGTDPIIGGAYIGSAISAGGSVSAVPEPATWAMMILGMMGLAGLGLRRRQAALAV